MKLTMQPNGPQVRIFLPAMLAVKMKTTTYYDWQSFRHASVSCRQFFPDMEPGQDFWPVTRPDPTRSLSVLKQYLDNGLIAVSVTCQEMQT